MQQQKEVTVPEGRGSIRRQQLVAMNQVDWTTFSLGCGASSEGAKHHDMAEAVSNKKEEKEQKATPKHQTPQSAVPPTASPDLSVPLLSSALTPPPVGEGGGKQATKGRRTAAAAVKKRKKPPCKEPPALRLSDMPAGSDMRRDYLAFQRFFGDCDILETWTEPMVATKKDDNNSKHSGRLLEFFMSNFVKDHSVVYYLLKKEKKKENDSKVPAASAAEVTEEDETKKSSTRQSCEYFESFDDMQSHYSSTREECSGQPLTADDYYCVNVQCEYAQMMRRHQKLGFDLCRRGTKVLFEYRGRDGNMRTFKTTFCQLILFWWAGCLYLQEYWTRHHLEIRACQKAEKKQKKQRGKKVLPLQAAAKKRRTDDDDRDKDNTPDGGEGEDANEAALGQVDTVVAKAGDARSKHPILVARAYRRSELGPPLQTWDACDTNVCEPFICESDDVMRAAPHFSYFNPVLQQQSLI